MAEQDLRENRTLEAIGQLVLARDFDRAIEIALAKLDGKHPPPQKDEQNKWRINCTSVKYWSYIVFFFVFARLYLFTNCFVLPRALWRRHLGHGTNY